MFFKLILILIYFCELNINKINGLIIDTDQQNTNKHHTNLNNNHKNNLFLDSRNTKVWGPGLRPDKFVLPVRYFFIHARSTINGNLFNQSLPEKYDILIYGTSPKYGTCRYHLEQIDRRDGSIIVRYKILDKCLNFQIYIRYNGKHIAESPYRITVQSTTTTHQPPSLSPPPVYGDECNCPRELNEWLNDMECPQMDEQIEMDLYPFKLNSVNFTQIRRRLLEKYNNVPGSVSLCNYALQSNRIYRRCYGQYTGFKMFMDAVLSSLVRKVKLPDMEFFMNLGDWPLIKKGGHSRTSGPLPVFSWCGSDDTFDIVLPTYDLTESTLEMMGRVALDILSVQTVTKLWWEKENRAFFRGRDSSRQRLDLIDLGRKHPHLLNVSLTNFFFFRDHEEKYGPKQPHISLMNFFDYRYQINMDGTVAAYRFPYLLAGNSLVFKQESPFYEHFYKKLLKKKQLTTTATTSTTSSTSNQQQETNNNNNNLFYIPFKRDLSDLIEKIEWAQNVQNEKLILKMIQQSREFINENLLPKNIYCYHVLLFKEWSKKLLTNIRIESDMEEVTINDFNSCDCTLSQPPPPPPAIQSEIVPILKDEL